MDLILKMLEDPSEQLYLKEVTLEVLHMHARLNLNKAYRVRFAYRRGPAGRRRRPGPWGRLSMNCYGALDISKDLEAREQPFKTTTGTELGRAVARSAQLDWDSCHWQRPGERPLPLLNRGRGCWSR